MIGCRHSLTDQDVAIADGYCPLCLADRLALLERRERALEAWREYCFGDNYDGANPFAGDMLDAIRDCVGPDGKEVE